MYATPILFSRAASELGASAATLWGRVENAKCDFFAANTAVSGSTIPSDTAIITAIQNAERMRIRIGTKFPVLGLPNRGLLRREPNQFSRPSPWPSTAFAADTGATLDAHTLHS